MPEQLNCDDMIKIRIKRGLNLPIAGEPTQAITQGRPPATVALRGADYVGLRPRIAVNVGDRVKLGQLLFTDKKIPELRYTSPGTGRVLSINRGPRRALESIVIALESDLENDDDIIFNSYLEHELRGLDRTSVTTLLLESGLWISLRSRPFSSVPDPETVPHSLFVTAMDTNPLAPSVTKIIWDDPESFINGLTVISKLTEGNVFLCTAPGDPLSPPPIKNLRVAEFAGPHPAGNVGTHIHFLDPVSRGKTVWHIHAQDVIAIGRLFTTGRLSMERVISLAGPAVKKPRLIRTRIGASVNDLTAGELREGRHRIISGSVLSGTFSSSTAGAKHESGRSAHIGRYHHQITVAAVPEAGKSELLGWLRPGLHRYSTNNIVFSRFFRQGRHRKFDFTCTLNGERRPIYPIGNYERIMPLDILPTYLLRALAIHDIDEAERLGCLELDEEDLSLCSFVSPSKLDYGLMLRENLALIQKELS